jgi:glycosyltransferase involved in cell wall biosynthesis
VEAVRGLSPETAIELRAHASNAAEDVGGNLQREVTNLAGEDARIRILPPLVPGEVPDFLQSIDVLAVPSQWLETGPLVVLEALAAGTPVIGSRLGGISELVRDGENGLLVPHADAAAWRAALLRLLDPELRQRLRDGIGAVRAEALVARETFELYREVLSANPARPST